MRWPWQQHTRAEPAERITASPEMRDYCGFSTMEPPERVLSWVRVFLDEWPFTEEAKRLILSLRIEIGDLSKEHGGGYWWPSHRMVQLRGCQAEAAIHEFAHAYWEGQRTRPGLADQLINAVVRLASETDPRYARARELAGHYVHGIPTQPDPTSPTGYWRGLLVDRNDWEMFAGLASGVMGDLSKLPPYIRPFYAGLFTDRAT